MYLGERRENITIPSFERITSTKADKISPKLEACALPVAKPVRIILTSQLAFVKRNTRDTGTV